MTAIAGTPAAAGYHLFPSPDAVRAGLALPAPIEAGIAATVARGRAEVRAVLNRTDDRLLVITGPCSVHDPDAAVEYAARLAGLGLGEDLLVVMRAYVEKPRTVSGWTGLVADPAMDGSHDVHRGLRTARRLLLDIAGLGIPVACEWLSPVLPAYLADLVSWGAIGARTSGSQVHRQLASGLPMPAGFKNGTDGDIQVAVDGCVAAARGHTFLGVTPRGVTGVVTSQGNPDCHIVLRGGREGPNYEPPYVAKALDMLTAAGLPRRLLVDASHGNSGKDHTRQPAVAAAVAGQVTGGQAGIAGVMLESFLRPGRQQPGPPASLVYGQSVTDACMGFADTARTLEVLAAAVRARRRDAGSCR
jgi:3-deoxy-7-phosphoheptulonate synthase